MKYPIDPVTTERFFGQLIAHDRAHRQMVQALTLLLQEAMESCEMTDDIDGLGLPDWHHEAEKLLDIQKRLKVEHENRLFNEKNGYTEKPPKVIIPTETVTTNYSEAVPSLGTMGQIADPQLNANINEREKSLGDELSEEDLARHFQERNSRKLQNGVDMSAKEPFKGMTLAEIASWENKQNNSNDLYKIKSRVQNLAVGVSGGNLTPQGEMLANTFVHVLKSLYDFAETVQDKNLKIKLVEKIRSHENMPAQLIAAAGVGIKKNENT